MTYGLDRWLRHCRMMNANRGSYVFPPDKYRVNGITAKPGSGVNISRINWNGSTCFISTHAIKFPFSYSPVTVLVSNVTDTRVRWNTSRGSIIVCDYLR